MTTFGSICSGIEAASVAFAPLGWRASWFSEIEPFPCSVLAHHYPAVPNLGDMTTIARRVLTGEVEAPEVLCGGTPCQAFSVAGLRESLSDERGNLTLRFVGLADAIDHVRGRAGKPACILLWENVPGVLSTKDNAFGCFLAGLAGEDEPLRPPGKGWADAGAVYGPSRAIAWRTLDAQYFGLAQRRRRVFVVASARNGFNPCTVLFEWEGVRRDTPPSRSAGPGAPVGTLSGTSPGGGWRFGADEAAAGQLIAGTLNANVKAAGSATSQDAESGLLVAGTLNAGMGRRSAEAPERGLLAFGGNNTTGPISISSALSAHGGTGRMDFESETFVAHSLRGEGFDASEYGTGRGTPLVPVIAPCLTSNYGKQVDSSDTNAGPMIVPVMAFDCKASGQNGFGVGEIAGTQRAMGHANSHTNGGGHQAVMTASSVRRLTPRECERLQGFPDDYTNVPHRNKPAADGPRYKALGNSWAVPCVRWIAHRIDQHMGHQ